MSSSSSSSSYKDALEVFERADAQRSVNAAQATAQLQTLLGTEFASDPENLKEQTVLLLAELYANEGAVAALVELMEEGKKIAGGVSKARGARVVTTLMSFLVKADGEASASVGVAEDLVEWAGSSGRKFLRQRMEAILAGLYTDAQDYPQALSLLSRVLKEAKMLDDKLLLVDLHLVESRVYHALRNSAKAKAALTSARTSSMAVYTPPLMQARIEDQAGVVQAAEKDYKTAYSYFFEAFEGYGSLSDMPELDTKAAAVTALKHMLLCKIMVGKPEEVTSLINSKAVLKFSGDHVTALQAVARAAIHRSLNEFQEARTVYAAHLESDPVIASHLEELYDSLFEANLVRIIEPYTSVQVAHVATTIDLPVDLVESKLATMILDGKLNGVLDQNANALIMFDEAGQHKALAGTLNVMDNMSAVVDTLFSKVNSLA